MVWSLATVLFPATYPGLDGATYLAMAAAAAVLFLASVLAPRARARVAGGA